MVNVLPPDELKKVWTLNRSRLILVSGLMLIGLAAAAALTLIPSYVALQIAAPPAPATSADAQQERADATALERSQILIRDIGPILVSTSSPSASMAAALSVKPPGVRITRIIYMRTETESQLTLIGSGNRDQVSAYKDALANTAAYSSVSVPVGALVGSEGGGFSIVLTGTF